jgi:ATP-dependent Clp protease adaptor protein ClpS
MYMDNQTKTKQLEATDVLELETSSLVLWNDEVNSFDWVIACLMRYCEHTFEQAANSANLVHTMGKHAVKHGGVSELEPIKTALTDKLLSVTIE